MLLRPAKFALLLLVVCIGPASVKITGSTSAVMKNFVRPTASVVLSLNCPGLMIILFTRK